MYYMYNALLYIYVYIFYTCILSTGLCGVHLVLKLIVLLQSQGQSLRHLDVLVHAMITAGIL